MTLETVIEKVKNLLDLANNNPNEHEAIAAALKAQELMAKYNIEMTDFKEDEEEIFEMKYTGIKRHSQTLKKVLGPIIAKNFCCKNYLVQSRGQLTQVVFYGYKKDVKIAMQVFTYIYETANKLADKYWREAKKNGTANNDTWNNYMTGFAYGVEEALARQCTALMIITPKEVEEKFAEKTKHWGTARVSLRLGDHDAMDAGKRDGKATMRAREIESA